MTTYREIVRAANEEINALVGSDPTDRDGELAMRRLNSLIAGLMGTTISEPLRDIEYDSAPSCELPINTRAVCTAGGITLTMPCKPQDGSRIAVNDAGADFSTSNVTIARNGRLLEGAASNITAATEGYAREWFYRADLSDWTVISYAAVLGDTFPFPADTEEAFTVLLAMRLSSPTGVGLTAESQVVVKKALSNLRARYRQTVSTRADNGVLRMSRQAFGNRGLR